MGARLVVGGAGVLLGLYGAFLLLSREDDLLDVAVWLVAGVVLHDAVLAPVVLVVAALAARLLPTWLRRPATVGAVVLGAVTLLALPVLGRFGARPDNPTLLDRPYLAGWAVLAGLVVASVVVVALVVRSRGEGTEGG